MTAYSDSFSSYELAIAIAREKCIRRRQILPSPDRPEEARWATEGNVPDKDLDTVKGKHHGR